MTLHGEPAGSPASVGTALPRRPLRRSAVAPRCGFMPSGAPQAWRTLTRGGRDHAGLLPSPSLDRGSHRARNSARNAPAPHRSEAVGVTMVVGAARLEQAAALDERTEA